MELFKHWHKVFGERNTNNELRNNQAMPKSDVEFAQDGLEKVALKAQEKNKKNK